MILMILLESQVAVSNLCYVSSDDWLVPISGTGFSASLLGNELPVSDLLYVLLQKNSFQIRPVAV